MAESMLGYLWRREKLRATLAEAPGTALRFRLLNPRGGTASRARSFKGSLVTVRWKPHHVSTLIRLPSQSDRIRSLLTPSPIADELLSEARHDRLNE
jgi:hypothetical protein